MSNLVKYKTDAGLEIQLTLEDVKTYFAGGTQVTDKEAVLFMELCRANGLNPFTRDAYLVKYGTSPASLVTGKETFTKRAKRTPDCDGWKAGIYIKDSNGKLERREGSLLLDGETLVGGWAEVYSKSRKYPDMAEVAFKEYNTGQGLWKNKPATMIRKVALVQALREAFPERYQGLYDASEVGYDGKLDEEPITITPSEYTVTDILPTMPPQYPTPAATGGPKNPLLNDVAALLQQYKTRMGYHFEEAKLRLEARVGFKLTDVGDNQALADAAMYEARRMLEEMESTPGIDDLAPEDILF